jgi:flagellar protein FliS
MVAGKVGLVVLLYDKLILRLQQAKASFEAKDIQGRSDAISKSIELIEVGLIAALDDARGGDLAARLRSHYQLWLTKLLKSKMEASVDLLLEVEDEVKTIKLAWDELKGPSGKDLVQ